MIIYNSFPVLYRLLDLSRLSPYLSVFSCYILMRYYPFKFPFPLNFRVSSYFLYLINIIIIIILINNLKHSDHPVCFPKH
jgi:hypothetical protein